MRIERTYMPSMFDMAFLYFPSKEKKKENTMNDDFTDILTKELTRAYKTKSKHIVAIKYDNKVDKAVYENFCGDCFKLYNGLPYFLEKETDTAYRIFGGEYLIKDEYGNLELMDSYGFHEKYEMI